MNGLAETAYAAYSGHFKKRGVDVAAWEDLPADIREAWTCATDKICGGCIKWLPPSPGGWNSLAKKISEDVRRGRRRLL